MQVSFSPFRKVICEPMQLHGDEKRSHVEEERIGIIGIGHTIIPPPHPIYLHYFYRLICVLKGSVTVLHPPVCVASEQWQRNFFKRTKRDAHANTHKRARKNNKH